MVERPSTNFIYNNNYGCKQIKNNHTNEIFQSIKEASEYFKVHSSTITRWVKNGNKVSIL
jgi:S-adenosylmethionine/arginine decarboxylase-like enzyme